MVWLPMVNKVEDTVTRFDGIHKSDRQTDGRTDGQTPHDDIGRAEAYAWHRAAKTIY